MVAVLGATGSGKTTYVLQLLEARRPRRVLYWDFKRRDYQNRGAVFARMGELVDFMLPLVGDRDAPLCGVFNPSLDPRVRAIEFNAFCHLALALGNLIVVVEELRFVTTPSRAPEAWSLLVMTGRDLDLSVIGTSQRPAHIDKDFLGNSTSVHCGRLEYPEDRDAVAKVLQISPDQLAELQDLEYVHRGPDRVIKRGRIAF